MHVKKEGPLFRPVPLVRPPRSEVVPPGRKARAAQPPRCEMCGAEVTDDLCRRICLRCGFMTECSEELREESR